MATSFDRAALRHVAELATLSLTDEEADALAGDIQRIVAYVDELASVDTTDVPPTMLVTPPDGATGLRADEPAASLDRARDLAGAPRASDQGFLVPTFVESGS